MTIHKSKEKNSSPVPFIENKERRLFLLSGGLGVAAILSGCTARLYANTQYTETISSILISQDNKKIVVIGMSYHYVFDAPDVLIRTLTSSFHKSVKGDLSGFTIDSSNAITGDYLLKIEKEASEQEKLEAIAVGFVKSGEDLIFNGKLNGFRYSAGGIIGGMRESKDSLRLNKIYTVKIFTKQSTGEKVEKLLLTPVTVAADGVLLIGMIPLIAAFGLIPILMGRTHY